MSDIILVDPIPSFAAFYDGTESEWPASGFIGYPSAPQSHAALYEWIRRFVEDQRDAVELSRAEAALRELICLDESRMRVDRLARWHLFALHADIQRRDAALAATEALSRYKLHRLIHKGSSAAPGKRPLTDEAELMRELRELLDAAEAPATARATAAWRAAEDRLCATGRVLGHQAARLEKTQAELHAACHALNEIAECAGVAVRCEAKHSGEVKHSGGKSPADVAGALCEVIRGRGEGMSKAHGVECMSCERLRSDNVQLQYQVLQLQEQLRIKQQSQYYTHEESQHHPHVSSGETMGDTCGFDMMTSVLRRLEETRAQCYALEELAQKVSRTNSVRWSRAETSLSDTSPLNEPFSLESIRYDEHLSIVHELREIMRMARQLGGVRAVLLRRGASEYASPDALSVFPTHGLSLHQWFSPNSPRPVRCAAVLYALPPSRAVNVPRAELDTAAAAGKVDLIDLSRSAELSGDAVRFSTDGSCVYVCAGDATAPPTTRAKLRHAADALCKALGIPQANCFVYFDAARDGRQRQQQPQQRRRLGWAGDGICAWALDEMFFEPQRERERFDAHLRKAYKVVLSLSRDEVNAFAGDCVEIVARSLNHRTVSRRLIISKRAMGALSAKNRGRMLEWYSAAECLVPDLATIERVGGYSAGSVVLTVVTHGAQAPPPSACGFLAVSGIGQNGE